MNTVINNRALTPRIQHSRKIIDHLLKTQRQILETATKPIVFSPPLITRDGISIIHRGTVNVIQGSQGSHKSRLAEMLCSLLLNPNTEKVETLGFEAVKDEEITVVYVDTERNETEEFPLAIQNMVKRAGSSSPLSVENLELTSLKAVPRKERLESLQLFIEHVRSKTKNSLFILLDVITDCVSSFNDLQESMLIIDFLGNLCQKNNATVLLIIHENPGSDKARGHLGTEAINKSSTVIHIGFEKGKDNQLTDLIQLKYIKMRHSKRLPPIPIVFSEETMSLKVADEAFVKSIMDQRREKADIEEIKEKLPEYLKPKMLQKELLEHLGQDFKCSEGTIKSRLEEIIESREDLLNERLVKVKLKKQSSNGKPTFYELVEEAVS